jgi:hypothetical protein
MKTKAKTLHYVRQKHGGFKIRRQFFDASGQYISGDWLPTLYGTRVEADFERDRLDSKEAS